MHQGLPQAGNVNGTPQVLILSAHYSIAPLSQEALPYPRVCNAYSLFCLHRLKHSLHINSVIKPFIPPPSKILFVSQGSEAITQD